MSKGLEALKKHKITLKSLGFTRCEEWHELIIIEKELKEYEEMKAIKGTTTFDKAIEDTLINACPNVAKKLKDKEQLEKAFDSLAKDDEKAKKLLSKEIEKNRALEIIKNKYLDPHDFVLCYYTMNNEKWIDYEEYKKAYLNYYENDEYMLTQEEYDLLKEVLL